MKKLDNKGVTILELVISVAMLSISLIVMYGLITNLTNRKMDIDATAGSILKINEIEQTIQNNIMGYLSDNEIDVNIELKNYQASIEINNSPINIDINNDYDSNKSQIVLDLEEDSTWSIKGKTCKVSELSNVMFASSNNPTKAAGIVIECKGTDNRSVDYIKIPLYFKNMTGNFSKEDTCSNNCFKSNLSDTDVFSGVKRIMENLLLDQSIKQTSLILEVEHLLN